MNLAKLFGIKKEKKEPKYEKSYYKLYKHDDDYRDYILYNDFEETIYYSRTNTYEKISSDDYWKNLRSRVGESFRLLKITKDEYNNYLDYYIELFECNCKLGDGLPNVKISKQYNIEEEYNNSNNNSNNKYKIKFDPDKKVLLSTVSFYNVYESDTYIGDISFGLDIVYHQKACLNCESCLDERNKLIKDVQSKIDVLIKEKDDIEKVKQICEGETE